MSEYYNPKKTYGLFDPRGRDPFKLSRSKIDLFINCPRCFYLDRRLGVGRPPGFPFALNSAVDALLKKEFDLHRARGESHPLMNHYQVEAIPFQHEKIDEWRNNWVGIQFFHQPTNFLISGAIDDVWINPQKELIVVDYKATAKNSPINLDADWQKAYKRQVEVYQWLFRRNGFKVAPTCYFVYVNGKTDAEAFDGKLEFDIHLLPYQGDDSWIEGKLSEARECLTSETLPAPNPECDYCNYRWSAGEEEKN